jgi:hypothetical protein
MRLTESRNPPGGLPSVPTLLTNSVSEVVVLLIESKPRVTKLQLLAGFTVLSHGMETAQTNYCLCSSKLHWVRLQLPLTQLCASQADGLWSRSGISKERTVHACAPEVIRNRYVLVKQRAK